MIPAREALELGVEGIMAAIPGGVKYYVTIDIDVLDISQAAGMGSPVPGGLSWRMLIDILEAISKKGDVVCFDLVEVAPQYDHSEATSRIAALTMLHFMGFIMHERGKKKV